jgi:tRNA-uridine 2-sulfurtransferase
MNRKAISLLSGGLDSILATRLVKEQGVEVRALHFTSPFCTCTKGDKGCGLQAIRSARELDVEVLVRLKGMDYLEIVRSPKHGYGRAMNPCIDCRIFMLREARKLMDETGASFVITGEVLGQRPMSQRRDTIALIEKESGLEGLILRPLSAKHFPPTLPEIEGIVDREKLYRLAGRGRKLQYELVEERGLTEFSCPGGGCLLTEPGFVGKMRDLFAHEDTFTMRDVGLLKMGRHFRLRRGLKLILGKNERENGHLAADFTPPRTLLIPVSFKGPVGLLTGEPTNGEIEIAGNIMASYAKANDSPLSIELKSTGSVIRSVEKREIDRNAFII